MPGLGFTLLDLTKSAKVLFKIAAPSTLPPAGQGCSYVPLSSQHSAASFLITASPIGVKHLILVLICMSLITNNFELLVICVIAFWGLLFCTMQGFLLRGGTARREDVSKLANPFN